MQVNIHFFQIYQEADLPQADKVLQMMTLMPIFPSNPTGHLGLLTYLVIYPQMLFVPQGVIPGPKKS